MQKHNNFMNYINLNQRAFIDFGLKSGVKVDLIDATITSWLIQFMNAPKTKKILVNGEAYTLIRYSKILSDNPLIMIKTKRAMINRINKLLGLGIIEKRVVNENNIKNSYFKLTELAYNVIVMSNELKASDLPSSVEAYKSKLKTTKFVKKLRGFALKIKWSNTPLGSEARFTGVVKQDSLGVVKQDSHYRINQFNSINYNSNKNKTKEKVENKKSEKKVAKKDPLELTKKLFLDNGYELPKVNLETFEEWMVFRKKKKLSSSKIVATRLFNKSKECETKGIDANEMVEASITNGWKDLFVPKVNNFKSNYQQEETLYEKSMREHRERLEAENNYQDTEIFETEVIEDKRRA